jgi:hypothetical protein
VDTDPTSGRRRALRLHPKAAGIVAVFLLYTASLVLDRVASSYPPVSTIYPCRTVAAAQRLASLSTDLIALGGLMALTGLLIARGKRRWYLALALAIPLLIVLRIEAVLDPGANCHTVF